MAALPPSAPDPVAAALASPPARRALVGLASSAPFLGAFAAFSTMERVQRANNTSPTTLLAGCRVGLARWAPFGVGAALFYALEPELRPRVAALPFVPAWALPPAPPPLALAGAAGGPAALPPAPPPALTQYEQLFGRPADAATTPESVASKVLAGAAVASCVCGVLFLRRSRGFRSAGSVLGTVAGCAVAASFMPSYEGVERRSLL